MARDGDDTIFALSSGPGPAGVAVIRVSGPRTRFALETLTDSVPEPRAARLAFVRDEGLVIDQALVIFFPGPASFTGEDVAEFQVHGGRAVIAGVFSALARLSGFRPAEAGEFSRRAFLNRKLDLSQVEALADLVSAETEAQRRLALRNALGEASRLYDGWRGRLVRARAYLEAEFDFPDEEDVAGSVSGEVWADVAALGREIASHLDDGGRGERLRDGATIAILGPPNAGKSSLINSLTMRDVAIVAPEPGTTRDPIEVRLDLGGYPVSLIDTAGIREAVGAVEQEGIRRATRKGAEADLVLWLEDLGEPRLAIPDGLAEKVWRIGTKSDLGGFASEHSSEQAGYEAIISTKTGQGLDGLLAALTSFLKEEFSPGETLLVARARHRTALAAALIGIRAALDGGLSGELRAEELRRATDELGRVTGRVDVDDLLDVIFRDFCIGK